MDLDEAEGAELPKGNSGFETIQWNRMQSNGYLCLKHQPKAGKKQVSVKGKECTKIFSVFW